MKKNHQNPSLEQKIFAENELALAISRTILKKKYIEKKIIKKYYYSQIY